jgi:hypothetical protein
VIKFVIKEGKFPIRFITIYPMFIHRVVQIEKKENKKKLSIYG